MCLPLKTNTRLFVFVDRTWPFWPENMKSKKAWQGAAEVCEGMHLDAAQPAAAAAAAPAASTADRLDEECVGRAGNASASLRSSSVSNASTLHSPDGGEVAVSEQTRTNARRHDSTGRRRTGAACSGAGEVSCREEEEEEEEEDGVGAVYWYSENEVLAIIDGINAEQGSLLSHHESAAATKRGADSP